MRGSEETMCPDQEKSTRSNLFTQIIYYMLHRRLGKSEKKISPTRNDARNDNYRHFWKSVVKDGEDLFLGDHTIHLGKLKTKNFEHSANFFSLPQTVLLSYDHAMLKEKHKILVRFLFQPFSCFSSLAY